MRLVEQARSILFVPFRSSDHVADHSNTTNHEASELRSRWFLKSEVPGSADVVRVAELVRCDKPCGEGSPSGVFVRSARDVELPVDHLQKGAQEQLTNQLSGSTYAVLEPLQSHAVQTVQAFRLVVVGWSAVLASRGS